MASTIPYTITANISPAERQLLNLYNKSAKRFNQGFNISIDRRSLTGFDRSLDQATSRIISFTATTTLLYQTGNALKRLAGEAIEVQTAITGIQSILNATNKDLSSFTQNLFQLANKTGVGFFDAAAAANEFSRAGLSLEKTLQATGAALGIVRTSGGSVTDAVQGLISAVNSFEPENLGFQEVADKLSALDAAFSTSAAGLIQGFGRVGVAASDAGVTFDELGGLIASVKQISGRSETQIGNSLKAIFVSLQNANIQDLLEGVGVATKNANGEFRTATDVLKDLAGAFTSLSDAQRAFLSQKIAGKFQANAFATTIQAIQNGSAARGQSISAGADNDIAKRLEILNATTATTIQRFQNTITEISSTLGDAVGRNFVEGLLKYGNNIGGAVKSIFEKNNPIGDIITSGLSAALTGPGIVLAITLLAGLTKKVTSELFKSGKSLLGNQLGIQKTNALLREQELIQANIAKTQASIALASKQRAAAVKAINNLTPPATGLGVNSPRYQRQLAREQERFNRANSELTKQQGFLGFYQQQDKINAAAAKRRERLGGGLLAGSFIAAAGTAAISSQLDEGKTKRLVDAAGQGVATALIISSFGKLGLVLGPVVGGFQILSQYLDEVYGNIEDLRKQAQEEINQNDKARQSGDLYIQSLKAYQEALDSGKQSVIRKADRDLLAAQKGLDPSRKGLLGIKDINKIIELNDKLSEQTDVKNIDASLPVSSQKIIDEVYSTFIDKLSGQFNKYTANPAIAEKLASEIVGAFDLSKVSTSQLDSLLQGFSKTGNSQDIVQFIDKLKENLGGVNVAFDNFSNKLDSGTEELSLALFKAIRATIEKTQVDEAESNVQKQIARGNKLFAESIAASFSNRNLNSEAAARARGFTLARVKRVNEGRTGGSADLAETQASILDAKNEFISSVEAAKTNFLPQLQDVLVKNVSGLDVRSKLLESIDKILGDTFDPSQLRELLTSVIGVDSTNNVLQELNNNLIVYNTTLKNADSIYRDNLKNIREVSKQMEILNRKILGNPREDQSANLAEIRAGGKAYRASLIPKRDRYGNLVTDTKDPNNISAAKIEAARKDLDRLEIEGKTGIRTSSPAQVKGRVRGDFETLINAQRVQADQGIIGDLFDEFLQKNKKTFGFGNSATATRENILKQIADGNFQSVNNGYTRRDAAALDRNSFLNSVRANSNLPGATELITAIQEAKKRFENQNSIIETESDKFLKGNDLLQNIADNTRGLLELEQKTVGASGNVGAINQQFSNFQLAKEFTLSSQSQDLSSRIVESQKRINDLTSKLFNPSIEGQADANNKLNDLNKNKTYFGATGFFSKQQITDDEKNTLKNIFANNPINKYEELIRQNFTSQGNNGESRADELIKRLGVLDPFKSQDLRNRTDIYQQNTEKARDEEVKKIETLKKQKEDVDNQIKEFEKVVDKMTQAVSSLSEGVSSKVDANIDVNVQGNGALPSDKLAIAEQKIREIFVSLFTEATGKAPVLAPTASA